MVQVHDAGGGKRDLKISLVVVYNQYNTELATFPKTKQYKVTPAAQMSNGLPLNPVALSRIA